MKKPQQYLGFDTDLLLSMLSKVLNQTPERDILIPIKALEMDEESGEQVICRRHQFDSRYSRLTKSTKILIPTQISDDEIYNIFVSSNKIKQERVEQIRFVKTMLIATFTKMEILAEYNKGDKFVSVIDTSILLPKILEFFMPKVLGKIVVDYYHSSIHFPMIYQSISPILPVMIEKSDQQETPIVGLGSNIDISGNFLE